MSTKSMRILWKEDHFYFVPLESKDGSYWGESPPFLKTPDSQSDSELGEVVLSHLEYSKVGIQEYLSEKKEYVSHRSVFGFKTDAPYYSNPELLQIRQLEAHYTITAYRNRRDGSSHNGYVKIPRDISPAELGHQIKLAFARCSPGYSQFKAKFFPEVGRHYKPRGVMEKVIDSNATGPIEFGHQHHWIAIKTTDTNSVIQLLNIHGCKETPWEEGLEAVYRRGATVYVSPPIQGWTFVLNGNLDVIYTEEKTERVLCALSQKFGEAQLYCVYAKAVEVFQWAKARDGEIVRWVLNNQENGDLKIRGEITSEEKETLSSPDELSEEWHARSDEVFDIAELWSLDPSQFSPGDPESVGPGLLGRFAPD